MNSLNANSVSDMIDAMRSISPAGYASSVIYMSFMTNPVISAIIALICRKSPNFGKEN